MLIVRRKPNQAVMIGANVRIVVVGVEGESVRLGIEAPADVLVRRGEADSKVATSHFEPSAPSVMEE